MRGQAAGRQTGLTFGVFDHLDRDGTALGEILESRLRLVELCEREGYFAYHLAEHHATPLGSVPSPSVFLAAAIQRTATIRLGPLVYVLPLYHPLRLFEEICMLDHMSGGRMLLGIGRGGALIEHARYGVDPAEAPAMYHEAFAVLMRAFESEVLDFEGRYYRYRDYLVQAKPLQRPHPPLWYGAPNAEAVAWAAPLAVNVVSLGPASRARDIAARYRQEWRALGRADDELPKIGITRHIVVAASDEEAMRIARRAYPRWRSAMDCLWRRSGTPFPLGEIYPADFDALAGAGYGFAGAPDTVRGHVRALAADTGVNYVLCQLAFGDMTEEEIATGARLFAREVMPSFVAPG